MAGLQEGMEILLDGHTGLLASPVPAELPELVPPAPLAAGAPLHTTDVVSVQLLCSVTNPEGAVAALNQGAAGLGLVRSEYLFPEDGRQPDADFLAVAMAEVCRAAHPLEATFRLVDVAGDKRPPWLGEVPGFAGVLGLQGARLYAHEPVRSVYLAELAALAQLAGQYRIKVLLPYVVSLAELESLVAEIRQHLPADVPIGTMLETPAAALSVREFLAVADFAALGCNDLMQCLFAADRDMPELRAYLDPYAPAFYRFLDMVARMAGRDMGRLQVNGLLAQRPGVLPVLLGMGFRIFSVDPVMLPWLAETVQRADIARAVRLARAVCAADRPEAVKWLVLQ
jgi:phosphoenolpyruvate-protein kinase (PTS system EI component)